MNLNVGDTQLIIAEAAKCGLLRNQLAYVLATTWHETGGKMKPVTENLNYSVAGLKNTFSRARISAADCDRYGRKDGRAANQKAIANCVYGGEWGRKNLGNTGADDGWLYRGRGYVQITGRENYRKFDIADNPDMALNGEVAACVLIKGMQDGIFTGKKLSDYITLKQSDYVGARRIINGTDKADLIAGYAKQYDNMLLLSGYGVETEPTTPITPPSEPLVKSKRLLTWLGTFAATVTGFLHPAAQVACVVIVGGIAAYAIYSMPQVKSAFGRLFDKIGH